MLDNLFEPQRIKRKVFLSYHHSGDQHYYDIFCRHFCDVYDVVSDNSLDRKIDSDNVEYVIRRIRDNYVTGSSCTIVLVGADTWGRKFVDWEITATLERRHGLIGLQLPSLPIANGVVTVPDRLSDNIRSGYAVWMRWDYLMSNEHILPTWIEEANHKDVGLIRNDRQRRLRNA
jgi:hypothetical protein